MRAAEETGSWEEARHEAGERSFSTLWKLRRLQLEQLRQPGHAGRRDEPEVTETGVSGLPVSIGSDESGAAEFKILPGLDPGGEICQEGNLT